MKILRCASLLFLVYAVRVYGQPEPTFVTVRGGRVHVSVQGQGTPPVVFESGLGEDVSTWGSVQPEIAKSTLTLAYERKGLGLSSPATGRRDGLTLAAELHELLQAKKLKPPYILVGHSLGGAVVQVFASRYPKEVAGLVLVDPEDGRIVERLKAALTKQEWAARDQALAKYGPMPPAMKEEYDDMVQSGAEVETIEKLGEIPIVLLSGTQVDPGFPGNPVEQRIKLELHRQFVGKNPQTKQILVPESRHYIQNDAPEKVIEAIRKVLVLAGSKSRPNSN